MQSTNGNEPLPDDIGFFWALPTTDNSLTKTSFEYGLITKSSRAVTYEAGISSGGFENLGVRDFLKYDKDAEVKGKTEYYGYQEGTGFLYNL